METEFTKFIAGRYEVGIAKNGNYGYFEHITYGGDRAGQLIFEKSDAGNVYLYDYDGVFQLPRDVIVGLRAHHILVDTDFE